MADMKELILDYVKNEYLDEDDEITENSEGTASADTETVSAGADNASDADTNHRGEDGDTQEPERPAFSLFSWNTCGSAAKRRSERSPPRRIWNSVSGTRIPIPSGFRSNSAWGSCGRTAPSAPASRPTSRGWRCPDAPAARFCACRG